VNDQLQCYNCSARFGYRLIHNGFNDSAYAYCDTCGRTALLSLYSEIPSDVSIDYGMIDQAVEPHISNCNCGGHFRANASPRCPHCHMALSAEKLTPAIEAAASGTKAGWRWQRNWTGLYAIIIEGRKMNDPWLT
jgi:hypothetical protein